MSYYINTVLKNTTMEIGIEKVTKELKNVGFGILTEIDLKKTLKNKLDVDFKDYIILGACNPGYVHKAIQEEDKIGAFLPCNVIVQKEGDDVEISIVDPMALMQSVKNPALENFGTEVKGLMEKVIENLEK